MNISLPKEIDEQLIQVTDLIKKHIPNALAIHLYGSILDGGLKPYSDIDLLVTIEGDLSEERRRNLSLDLLKVSAPPAENPSLRAMEVTVVSLQKVVPWKYPAHREMQFGEWLRKDLLKKKFEPAMSDPDLAILITKVRKNSLSLHGPAALNLFDPVPKKDFTECLKQTLSLWNEPADWKGDERNILLTLARIWYSAETDDIASKENAADWLLERLPAEYRDVLRTAQEEYLGHENRSVTENPDAVEEFILYAKQQIENILSQ